MVVSEASLDVGYCDTCDAVLDTLFGAILICTCDKRLCNGCAEEHEEQWHWSWTRETDEENLLRGHNELTLS